MKTFALLFCYKCMNTNTKLSSFAIILISMFLLAMQNSPRTKFPSLTAETLAGNKITLPEAVKGKKAFLVIAFERKAQSQADDWYEVYAKQFQAEGYVFYELPMISSMWKWMSGFIDSGMRSGVPSYKHNNVATYYGPLDEYIKAFGVKDRSLVYVFTLNEQGEIVGRTSGGVEPGKIMQLK
jgi:hypothetical protein